MEVAEYGDTEITAAELKATVENHKQCDKDKIICKMEEEFDVSLLKIIFLFNIKYLCVFFRILKMHMKIGNLVQLLAAKKIVKRTEVTLSYRMIAIE